MPIPWSFNCFSPNFNFNNSCNFNNFNPSIWSTNNKFSFSNFTPPTFTPSTFAPSANTDSFVKTSSTSNNTDNKLKDYNPFAGHRLAEIAMQGRQFNSWDSVPEGQGKCAFFVSNALDRAGMSNGMRGDAYQMINILKLNNNFKQIPTNNIDIDEIPAGSILAYERGSQGYSEDYGHIEIMTEDGKGVSQAITYDIKEPDALFIPV